ncbi:MAG: hypothetical protein LBV54_02710 [Puniceicoccales bacterium]|nr:hypothetical protein [Puniceicoccales bacterium]
MNIRFACKLFKLVSLFPALFFSVMLAKAQDIPFSPKLLIAINETNFLLPELAEGRKFISEKIWGFLP